MKLPIVRDDYGFQRTKCGCKLCGLGCRFTPGMLGPDDVQRIAAFLEYGSVEQFARENLRASAGAKFARMTPNPLNPNFVTRTEYRVPTLVPARQENGHCKFLSPEGRCKIHAVAPFGCAFFDAHQSDTEANTRSLAVHRDIKSHHDNQGPYGVLWNMLKAEGLVGIPPEQLQAGWKAEEDKLRANKKTGHTPKKDRNRKGRR